MIGIFLVGLIIVIAEALAPLWPILAAIVGLYGVWCWIVVPAAEARAVERHDRQRHERARREIDWIAMHARREMIDAALSHTNVIEGTAVEVTER
jgi:uncharacterized membrane protein YuzA (DUF378 family)